MMRPGPCSWEGSSGLSSTHNCPPDMGPMSLFRACTPSSRQPLENWDPGPLMAAQPPKHPSRASVQSVSWPWRWASGGGCVGIEGRAWRQGLGHQLSVMLNRTRKGKGGRLGHRLGAGWQGPAFPRRPCPGDSEFKYVLGLLGIFIKVEE